MRYNYVYLAAFFVAVALVAYLIFPGQFDMVTMYRNSYLYNQALALLDKLEAQRPQTTRIDLERGHVLYLAGRYEEAARLLERVAAREPNNVAAWRRLAAAYRVLQRPKDAMVAFERIAEHAPADREALYLLDEYYRWFQMPKKAIANLQALTRHYPRDRYNWEKLYDLYLRTNQLEGAIRALEGAVEQFPDNLEERAELGRLFLIRRDPGAVQVFEALHLEVPESDEIAEDLVNALVITGRPDRAVEIFTAHYQDRSDPATYHERLADLYASMDRPAQAARALEQKLNLSPSEETRLAVATFYQDAEEYGLALSHVRILLESNPQEQEFWQICVELLQTLEMKDDLVVTLERYVEQWPEDWAKVYELADAYNWIEAYQEEAVVLERLIRAFPGRNDYRRRLAEGYYARRDYRKAAEQLARLVRARPDVTEYRALLLAVVQDLGTVRPALKYARMLYEAEGGGTETEAGLILIRLHGERGEHAEADRIGRELIRRHPENVDLRVWVGRLAYDQGRTEEARANLRAAVEMAPEHPDALAGIADILGDDRPQEALAYLSRLYAVDPERPETAYRIGSVHESLADTARAAEFYRRFLELAPRSDRTDVYFWRQRAHALYRTGSTPEALDLLDDARERHPADLELVNDTAEILIHLKRYDQAMSLLSQLGDSRN